MRRSPVVYVYVFYVHSIAQVLSLGVLPPTHTHPFIVPSSTQYLYRHHNYNHNHNHGHRPSLPVRLRRSVRASSKDDNDERRNITRTTAAGGTRSRKRNEVAVAVGGVTCFLAGISLGAQVVLATTTTTTTPLLEDRAPSPSLTTGLLVSADALSLPDLSGFKFGFGGSAKEKEAPPSPAGTLPEASNERPEANVSESDKPSSADGKSGDNDGGKTNKSGGGFSLPGNFKLDFNKLGNNDNNKPPEKELIPKPIPEVIVPEPAVVVDTSPAPSTSSSTKSKGLSLPDLSNFKFGNDKKPSEKVSDQEPIPKPIPEVIVLETPIVVDTAPSSDKISKGFSLPDLSNFKLGNDNKPTEKAPVPKPQIQIPAVKDPEPNPAVDTARSSTAPTADDTDKKPKGFSIPNLSTFKFEIPTNTPPDKQPATPTPKTTPSSSSSNNQFAVFPGLSNFKLPSLPPPPPPITTGPRPQTITPPSKVLFPDATKNFRSISPTDRPKPKPLPERTQRTGPDPNVPSLLKIPSRPPRPEPKPTPDPKPERATAPDGKPGLLKKPSLPTPGGGGGGEGSDDGLPRLTFPTIVVPTPEEAAEKIERYTRERDEKEQSRRDQYFEAKRQKEEAKQMKIREYDEMFRKDQEERDRFYGQKALENRQNVEELKRTERDFVTKGIFSNSPLQIPNERGGEAESGEGAGSPEVGGGGVAVPRVESAPPLPPTIEPPQREKFQGQYITPLEERYSAAADRKAYSDKVALRKAREDVERLEQRISSEEKLGSIRAKRLEEEQLVRERAEVNAMKLQQAKERNAEIRLKQAQELRERQQINIEAARELREQADFERRMNDLDKYVDRKDKLQQIKIERSLEN